ncbi:MAG: ribonuclease T [Legionellales bacterium]
MRHFITLFLIVCSLHLHAITQRDAVNSCDIDADRADAYVLALSSQSGFCKTYGYEAGKPECLNLSDTSYAANHLTLHGLWPNQNACGQDYGFCTTKQLTNHCAYPPLQLINEVSRDLKKLMPSYQYGSCLERHEWNKHGSCQLLSADAYFTLAMRLTKEMDESGFGQFVTENRGKKVTLNTLQLRLRESFGTNNGSKVYLGCNKGVLVDIYISLPALIPIDESLESLISKAPDYPKKDACPAVVVISDFSTLNRAM